MHADLLAHDYVSCRSRFAQAAHAAGLAVESHPLSATGPDGEELAIDVAVLGARRPSSALVVLSGVHGVEGFIGSALQTDLIARVRSAALPEGAAVVLVHAVNPWGMAHDRRQNEHNVDLNRNWRRSERDPERNAAYDELHPVVCPNTAAMPSAAELLSAIRGLVSERGIAWVRDGITQGQYHHGDGLHFGGQVTEPSCAVLEAVMRDRLGSAARVIALDLHTGDGKRGALTLLSSRPPGSQQDTFLRSNFGRVASIEATVDHAAATSPAKAGAIVAGLADVIAANEYMSMTAEFGTTSDLDQLVATCHEQWVHVHGDPDDPAHRQARAIYRNCFTPTDPEWQRRAFAQGRALLDAALDALPRPFVAEEAS
jgi:hypothetical protein